jgi:perosamine synthetase
LFNITVNEKGYGRSRDELMDHLAEGGIETRPFFIPLHELPPFREESRRRGDDLPVTHRLSSSGINLPTFMGLTDRDIEYISDAIRKGRR